MGPYVRKVKTASGATAVQVVEKDRGRRRIVAHVGSAHTSGGLAASIEVAKQHIHADRHVLELGLNGGESAEIDRLAASAALVQRPLARSCGRRFPEAIGVSGWDGASGPRARKPRNRPE